MISLCFARELESNVALRVQDTDLASQFIVSGRGELHLAILIETMRREGYEFAVSKPEVIFRESERGLLEPVERVFIEVLADYLGAVSEMLGKRRGKLQALRSSPGLPRLFGLIGLDIFEAIDDSATNF